METENIKEKNKMKQKINLKYIKELKSCDEEIDRFINAGHKNFNGDILEFLRLDNLSFEDKKRIVFHANQKILSDNLMREFAIICASRTVDNCNIEEVEDYFTYVLLELISGEYDSAAYYAAYSAAYSAAYYAAYSAASYAARSSAYYAAYYAYSFFNKTKEEEENVQLEILIDLIENGLSFLE